MERALTGLARLGKGKSYKDLTSAVHKDYPVDADSYELLDDAGRGVSATVHRAFCRPLHEIVAIKRMNLESLNCDLDEIIHEAQTMKAYHHPNVLPLYCSFVSGQELWMVMPFVGGGSVLHIMKYAHPEGLDEVVIATIMRDVLRALEYVHKQGGIHRDIKAGNILIDANGHVNLADFGVAASMERTGSWGHDKSMRMTFVGTPCWMAPEVMEQTQGYDNSADIWSFGITLLEMAHGHAPFAKFPPMKVLLMTLQNPPPTLDDKGKKHFSKAMRDVVTRCLQKDPRLRPTASQLLEHRFFKQARDEEFLQRNLMAGLPPLQQRVQEIRQGNAATNAQDNDKNFVRSQDEYKKGISAWNFDVAALKAQAAMEPDIDDEPALPTITESDETLEGTLSGMVANQAAAFLAAQFSGGERNTSGSQSTMSAAADGALAHHLQQQQGYSSQPQQVAVSQPQSSSGSQVPLDPTPSSAFASLQGQQQLLSLTHMASVPSPILVPDTHSGNMDATLSGGGISGGGGGTSLVEPSRPPVVVVAAATTAPGGGVAVSVAAAVADPSALTPLSPGNLSPSGLSREGSVQGPLANLALATTPTANKQKIKQQGRFQIYEPGSEPPAMQGVNGGPSLETVSLSHLSRSTAAFAVEGLVQAQQAQQPAHRISEDGTRRFESQDTMTSLAGFDGGVEVSGMSSLEPKKKGRFLVMEQAGISKTSSQLNLSDSSATLGSRGRLEALAAGSGSGLGGSSTPTGTTGGALPGMMGVGAASGPLGKPPLAAAPGSMGAGSAAAAAAQGGGGMLSAGVLLPKLQELQEHAALQQAALARLVMAVQEADRGRVVPLLSRTASTKSLFAHTLSDSVSSTPQLILPPPLAPRTQASMFAAAVQQGQAQGERSISLSQLASTSAPEHSVSFGHGGSSSGVAGSAGAAPGDLAASLGGGGSVTGGSGGGGTTPAALATPPHALSTPSGSTALGALNHLTAAVNAAPDAADLREALREALRQAVREDVEGLRVRVAELEMENMRLRALLAASTGGAGVADLGVSLSQALSLQPSSNLPAPYSTLNSPAEVPSSSQHPTPSQTSQHGAGPGGELGLTVTMDALGGVPPSSVSPSQLSPTSTGS